MFGPRSRQARRAAALASTQAARDGGGRDVYLGRRPELEKLIRDILPGPSRSLRHVRQRREGSRISGCQGRKREVVAGA